MASNVTFDRNATASWEERPNARNVVTEANRRHTHAWAIVGAGLLLIVSTLSYLNIQLSIGNGFRYAGALRIAFLMICVAFVAGAIAGLTQLSKR
jgi:cytochrome c oxidase subunit IV